PPPVAPAAPLATRGRPALPRPRAPRGDPARRRLAPARAWSRRGPRASDALVGIEELLVLVEREAIGHARDVVGDGAGDRLALLLGALQHVRGHLAGLLHVDLEERAHDAIGLLGHPGDAVVGVELLVQDALERPLPLGHRRRELDEARQYDAHALQAVDAEVADARQQGVHQA